MPTRKIDGSWIPYVELCKHPEHNPPMHIVYRNGSYEHECPGCKAKTCFTVSHPTL